MLYIIPQKVIDYVIVPAIIFFIATLLVYVVRKSVTLFLNNRSKFLRVDATNYSFLNNSISFLIYLIAVGIIIYTIPELKKFGSTVFAGAGILAAIIAFASQAAFSNIISGVFIVIFKPFRVGDLVEIDTERFSGFVEDITLRHTVIRDFQNKRIIIPNSIVSNKTIVNNNISDEKICRHIEIGISYDSDIDKAMGIMKDVCEVHPLAVDLRTQEDIDSGRPKVLVKVRNFLESSVQLRAWVWSEGPENSFELFTDVLYSIKKEFDANGIEIPFPHRTLVYKSDIEKQREVLLDKIKRKSNKKGEKDA
ncbi:MAG: mechanosensitive ion channel family protein [Candidatus Kapaibacteriales bacterium]